MSLFESVIFLEDPRFPPENAESVLSCFNFNVELNFEGNGSGIGGREAHKHNDNGLY
jgi:hypothetical protein